MGIVLVVVGARRSRHDELRARLSADSRSLGNFTDVGAVAFGIENYVGRMPVCCSRRCYACTVGALAVSLSKAYPNCRLIE